MGKLLAVMLAVFTAVSVLAESKPVVVVYRGMKEWTSWLKPVVKNYEKKYPGRKVKLMPIITSGDSNYETKIAMMLNNNRSIDLVFIDSLPTLHTYINAASLSAYPAMQSWDGWNQVYDYMKDGTMQKGKHYAVPITGGNILMFYNKNIFKKAGISIPWRPKTWQDIIDAGLKVKKTSPDVYPIWLTLKGNDEATTMFTGLTLLYGTGQKLYEDGKWIVTSKGLFDTLNFIYTLRKKNLLPPPPVIFDQINPLKMQQELTPKQKVAIFVDGAWINTSCWIGAYKKTRDYYDSFAFPTQNGQKPYYISIAGGWSVGISEKSSNKEAAWDFLKFFTSKESFPEAFRSDNAPPRKDAVNMKEYPEILKKPTELLKYGQHRPVIEGYSTISREFSTAIEAVSIGYTTPLQAMNSFANNVEMSLGKDKVVREYK